MAYMFKEYDVRSLTQEDLPFVLIWRNHAEVRRYMFSQHLISEDEHVEWFERVSRDNTKRLLIVLDVNEPIGFVQFNGVCEGGIASWGFYNRPNSPKGSGTTLGRAALNHAFIDLRLHKVCGQAIDSNKASIALHRKLGFTHEGALREQQRIEGCYHTLLCFGLLAHEWLPDGVIQEQSDEKN